MDCFVPLRPWTGGRSNLTSGLSVAVAVAGCPRFSADVPLFRMTSSRSKATVARCRHVLSDGECHGGQAALHPRSVPPHHCQECAACKPVLRHHLGGRQVPVHGTAAVLMGRRKAKGERRKEEGQRDGCTALHCTALHCTVLYIAQMRKHFRNFIKRSNNLETRIRFYFTTFYIVQPYSRTRRTRRTSRTSRTVRTRLFLIRWVQGARTQACT